MKIWLETHKLHSDQLTSGCDCDGGDGGEGGGGGGYSDYVPDINRLLPDDETQHICAQYLMQTSPLYIQECEQDRWLVCNPIGAGHIVIVDKQARFLLAQFREAKTVTDLQLLQPEISYENIKRATALFYRAGLLQSYDEPLDTQKAQNPELLTVWLHVTNACNLRCSYCYIDKTTENMSADTAFLAVDAIFRSAVQQGFTQVKIKYAGGEASLRMANVISVHDYAAQVAQEHGIELRGVLLSNGVMLAQRTIEQLKARNIRVMISLDGIGASHDAQRPFKEGQGSFKYVNRTIQRLLANGLVPSISVTISQRNLESLPELLLYILERDLPFTLNYYRDNECAATESSSLQFGDQQMIAAMRSAYKVIEQNLPARSLLGSLIDKARLSSPHQSTCGVGRNYMVIDQHGGIAKCQADIKQTVTTIAARDPLRVIQLDRTGVQGLPVEEKEGCRTCDWRYWCTGGCPLLTYRMTKRYDVKSPNCNIYQSLFPEVLRLEALRLLKYTAPIVIEEGVGVTV